MPKVLVKIFFEREARHIEALPPDVRVRNPQPTEIQENW